MRRLTPHARFTTARLAAALTMALATMILAFAAPVAAQDDQTVSVALEELNGSGASGSATLEGKGALTVVTLKVAGAAGGNPVHIHKGTCDDLDPNPSYPLTDINAQGTSVTAINVPLKELLADPYAINVHKAKTEIGIYITCGNIVAGVGGTTTESATATAPTDRSSGGTGSSGSSAGTTTTKVPATGVGTAVTRGAEDRLLLAGIGLLGATLMAAGFGLRLRYGRAGRDS